MAILKRKDLEAKGASAELIDYIMTESNRALAANYVPKSDLQEQIDAAVAEAKKEAPAPVKVEESEEYKALAAERDMLRAIGSDEFAGIKPKFRETVYGMIERGEDAPSLEDQLGKVREKYEEYFIPPEASKNTPVFSKPGSSTATNETEEDKLFAQMMESWDKH